MTGPAIELSAVTKRFRRKTVLDALSLTVKPGETFAFLGRNAAGKTTTIRLMTGLLRPDAGSARVLGMDPTADAMEIRRRIGYVAEDQAMFGWMRVEQLIRFMAPFYPTWDHDLARRFAADFDLPLRARVKHLSKGENVRLALLLALAHRPELVILDDPTLGLDPVMRRDFNRDLITHLQGEGKTVFYSSHLLHEVEAVADTVAILHGGRIVRQAATDDLRRRVKRIVLPTAAFDRLNGSIAALDVQRKGDETAVTVDDAPSALEALGTLGAEGAPHRVVDLNLDEIFEAFVTGSAQAAETTRESRGPREENA